VCQNIIVKGLKEEGCYKVQKSEKEKRGKKGKK
jgi:hypothetical protein